jgi:hypothetical protein
MRNLHSFASALQLMNAESEQVVRSLAALKAIQDVAPFVGPPKTGRGTGFCGCGRRISENKTSCRGCATNENQP